MTMASHNSKVKISRLRTEMPQRTLHTLLMVVMLLAQSITSAQSSVDYGDPDEFQTSGGGGGGSSNSEAAISNDDIYDAAMQQQEVEASEKQQQQRIAESIEAEAEAPTEMSLNQTHDGEHSDEEGTTAEELPNSAEMKTRDSGSSAPTTSIPAYVRKAKAEHFPRTLATSSVSAEESDANISSSDYVDEEEGPVKHPIKHHHHNQHHAPTQQTGDGVMMADRMDMDSIVPLAMKFYQSGADALGLMEPDDNKLKEQQPGPLSHQQQLPEQHLRQQFQPNNSDEDYYEDSHDSAERQHVHHLQHHADRSNSLTTSAPLPQPHTYTPAEATPTAQPPNIAVARAAAAGLPIPLGAAWGTTSTTSTSSPITAAPTSTPMPTIVSSTGAEPTIDKPAAQVTTSPPSVVSATTITATTAATVAATTEAAGLPESTATATATASSVGVGVGVGAAAETTMRPAGKQGKQINISRRKLLPHEQLRNYIEDAYIRMPLAVIVDPSAESLEKTKALWRDALRTNLNIKIVLVSLNASGIPAAYNFNNTRQFLAGLNSIKEHDGGNSFIGIVHASELVPYDSAVFISTANIPPHTELVQDAAITLLKKRIRLYLIWYGERAVSENETQDAVGGILGEVAIRSGGEILHIVGSENSQELEGNTLTLVADAFRGSQEVDIPVDTTLSSLHVKIDAPMRTATLETPNGDINLKKLVKFKSRFLTLGADDQRLDAYVPLTKLRKTTVFRLKMVPESLQEEYSVFVRAERKPDLFLDDMIKRFDAYFLDGLGAYPIRFPDNHLHSLSAAATITHSNLKFEDEQHDDGDDERQQVDDGPKSEVETFSDIEVHSTQHKTLPNGTAATMPTSIVNAINGNQRSGSDVLQRDTTKIEMGLQSQVLVAPGQLGQLLFDVTNTRSEAIYHNIQVVDERRFLLRLTPQSVFLRPGETTTVSVTVLVPNGTPQGTVDKITFTCHGGGTASLSLNLKVITTVDAQDNIPPSLSWQFGSRCEYVNTEAASCAERFWTLDITAQDWQTGMLRLQTTPAGGLIYRNSYTVGSTEPLKATYIAPCCNPKLAITAYDVAGNQRTHNIDVRDIVLTEASVAAIVLGALLLILLIALLIWGIVWCCRRRKVSLDLPTYRSHSTRSME